MISLLSIGCFFFCFSINLVQAQGSYQEEQIILKGKVKEVVSQKTEFLPGPNVEQTIQLLKVEILAGDKKVIQPGLCGATNDGHRRSRGTRLPPGWRHSRGF